ncbi:hypothetical protein ACFYWP_41295 [Actinacidiphila glaucinigra]|uniref:hypothetical protein n=1 Tax=Actinacidiphila glaucinigra TaxID=235986 RepID=UPI0036BBE566
MHPAADRPMADVRDVPVLHQAVRGVQPGDVRRVAVVSDHVALVCSLLQRHHRGQDLLLWPLLTARGGHTAAAVVPVMQEQHRAIEGARSHCCPACRPTRGDPAPPGARRPAPRAPSAS